LKATGAPVYVFPCNEEYDFILSAQSHSGETFADYGRSGNCDIFGLRPEIVSLLDQSSLDFEWMNPEQIGIFYYEVGPD
jgi:hypothetical protein